MQKQLRDWASKVWRDFQAFSAGQKAVTIVAVAALVVGGILLATWKTSPRYAPLYTNLAAQDAAAVVEKLNENGVPYELAAGGTQIMVPADMVYDTRLSMSAEGLPLSASTTGYSLLDKEGITTSDFKQQVDYQRAIEGELARTIESLDAVRTATVHLAIPQQNVFNDGSSQPTASVMLTLEPSVTITTAQVQSVVYLVASSVPKLDKDDVAVSDSSGRVLAAPGDDLMGMAGNDARAQMTQDYNNRLATALQTMLDRALGVGHSMVTVNAELDFDRTATTTQEYTYDETVPPAWTQESTESYSTSESNNSSDANRPNDNLGTGDPNLSTADSTSDGTYTRTDRTVSNALGTVTQTVENTPGALKNMSVAVLLDSEAPTLDVAAVEALVTSAVGLDTARGDSLAIEAVAFDRTAEQAAADAQNAASAAEIAQAQHERMMDWIKQGVIAGGILLLLIGTIIASKRRKRDDPDADPAPQVDLITHQIPPGALLAPEPMPASVIPEPSQETGASRRALIALAQEQPDDVARVLSGWLGSADVKEGARR